MDQIRRFAALRRRLNSLQHEQYTLTQVLEVTDWRQADHTAELQSLQTQLAAIEAEIADIEFLLHYYEHCMDKPQALFVTPHTVAVVAAIIIATFVLLTVAAGLLAGSIHAG